jgi:UDP-N-acetylmuramate-alanine ligase
MAPVYAAGEDPIEGIDSAHLVMSMKAGGHRDARLIDGPEALAPIIAEIASRATMSSSRGRHHHPMGQPVAQGTQCTQA